MARAGGQADQRDPVGAEQHLVLLPMFLQGRFVGDQLCMAYSETTWSWRYIEWLEEDPGRITGRCQNIARTWYTAVSGSRQWTTTQDNPSIQINMIKSGLRARDFNIECALEDPAAFNPDFSGFDDQNLVEKLQIRQEQLAKLLKSDPPPPLPVIEPAQDALTEFDLKDTKHLVGIYLDDPMFGVRHAAAQIRHCTAYLQTLNSLILCHPHGKYAQLLYNVCDSQSGLKNEINWTDLHEAVFESERKTCRLLLTTNMMRLVKLLDVKIPSHLKDWTYRYDVSTIEPYAVITESLNALLRLPEETDATYAGKRSETLTRAIDTLVHDILIGTHPLGHSLLTTDSDRPPILPKQIKALTKAEQSLDPEKLGISTLLLSADISGSLDTLGVAKAASFFITDILDNFTVATFAHISRLLNLSTLPDIERLIGPALTTVTQLSKRLADLKIMSVSEALEKGYAPIGLEGGGLRNGLTDSERKLLNRKSYIYASTISGSASSAGKIANSADTPIIALPKNHPELNHYYEFRSHFTSTLQAMKNTKALPSAMVIFSIYNLTAQLKYYEKLKKTDERSRGMVGVISASADLLAALGSHSQLLLGAHGKNAISLPRFDVSKVSTSWARNLAARTGSPRLSIIRGLGGAATLLSAAISAWDSYRALGETDYVLATSYAMMSVGSGLWGAYAIGFISSPISLLIGALLTIGALATTGLLANSDLELIVRHGPFGVQFQDNPSPSNFSHLQDPHIAYQQLAGTLGEPKLKIYTLAEWRKQASENQLEIIRNAENHRTTLKTHPLKTIPAHQTPIADNDWVVVLSSPLIAFFSNEVKPKIIGQEFQSFLDISQLYSSRQYKKTPILLPKLSAIPISGTDLLYIVPAAYDRPLLMARDRHRVNITVGLTLATQIELHTIPNSPPLTIPQPSPKKWSAFTPAHRRPPSAITSKDTSQPYWHIEQLEIPV